MIIMTLDGLVTELTLILLQINPPVKVIHRPLGLMTPLMCGTALALQVKVVMVRVLFIRQMRAML